MYENLEKIATKLKSKFYFNFDIYKKTWFRTGGKCDVFCEVYDQNEFEIILNNLDEILPTYVIGLGSNILIRDKGFRGIIFKLGKSFNKIDIIEDKIYAGTSILDINFSKFALMNSLSGAEFLSGIPGTLGGAIKMNAGCCKSETKDILLEINLINKKGLKKRLKSNDLELSYRNSNIKDDDYILSALFNLNKADKITINKKMKEIYEYRKKTQPLKVKTGGSTFKNPLDNHAGKLIENSECKGLMLGDAIVSSKHANFIINSKNASASNIEDLGKIIQDKVYKKFNILLEWEIKIIGEKN
ncbi:MAG: UDP-N-acetylenolpyruvoylglucosamine reductase [Alphaproteobacteria bacterium MarineAlpha5_Bin9]|nr:MAG: UDP-N-acetylenolpyruvoylglucosamine reductase [Alphaproteobacteria bacterium MarineAlpha5_Bin9]